LPTPDNLVFRITDLPRVTPPAVSSRGFNLDTRAAVLLDVFEVPFMLLFETRVG
jgi:hypothetical protein